MIKKLLNWLFKIEPTCICKNPQECLGDREMSVCRTKAWNANLETIKEIQKHWNKK